MLQKPYGIPPVHALKKQRMKKLALLSALFVLVSCGTHEPRTESAVKLATGTGELEGTLLLPEGGGDVPVALIIPGSGPTDRDGNGRAATNNSLKMLADGLSNRRIATLRYDKRGVGRSGAAAIQEVDLRFDQNVSDAGKWIDLLERDERFSSVFVIGHSEGSLVGMIASQDKPVSGFVSIAGAGSPADILLKEQLQSQPDMVRTVALPVLQRLSQGKTVNDIDPLLYSLFRPSVQPYLISWFKHDPAEEIAKLDIPVLIVQGTTDIQVSVQDAEKLAEANRKAELRIIEGMNHVFREADSNRAENIRTYYRPDLPIRPELVEAVAGFINSAEKQRFQE